MMIKVTIFISKNIKKNIPIEKYDKFIKNSLVTVLEIEDKAIKLIRDTKLTILLTEKIFNRKNFTYLKITSLYKDKNIIEIALKKSNVSNLKSNSNAIIHGFEEMTWNIIDKIIKNYKVYKNDTL